jgi:hypothetical protein
MSDKDIQFVDGLIVKAPRDGAPDFVKAAISIKRDELIGWLQCQSGDWVNLDVKAAKSGKWYAAVNTYKKEEAPAKKEPTRERQPVRGGDDFADESVPF